MAESINSILGPIGNAGELIPKPALARELGVSSRTISRWMDDPEISLPPPIIIRGRIYFERVPIQAWKAAKRNQAPRGVAA